LPFEKVQELGMEKTPPKRRFLQRSFVKKGLANYVRYKVKNFL